MRLFKGWDVKLQCLRQGESELIPSTEFVQYRSGGSFEIEWFVPVLQQDQGVWIDQTRRFTITLREDGVLLRRTL